MNVKVDQLSGGKRLIYGIKRHEENRLLILEYPPLSSLVWLIGWKTVLNFLLVATLRQAVG